MKKLRHYIKCLLVRFIIYFELVFFSYIFCVETLEESRRRENETKMYKTLNEKLENELKNCRNQVLIGQQGNNILGESTQQQILNVPGTVLSAIARKMTNLASSTESDDYRKVYYNKLLNYNIK